MEIFLQQTINAVALGGTYALLALGMAVIFSIMGMINFAHGELMTITGYTLFFCISARMPFFAAIPAALCAGALAAMIMELVAFRPVRGASPATLLVTSFAVSTILQILFQNLISTRPKAVPLPDLLSSSISLGILTVGVNQTISILVTEVTLVLLILFFKKTILGMSIRSAAEDFPVTRLMGIPANAVISTAFAISGLLAAIAGGLGSLVGAVAGGFALGFIEIYLTAFLPDTILAYKEPLGLFIVILLLLWRPKGLVPAASATVKR